MQGSFFPREREWRSCDNIAYYAKDPDKLPPTPTGRSWDKKMIGCAIGSPVV